MAFGQAQSPPSHPLNAGRRRSVGTIDGPEELVIRVCHVIHSLQRGGAEHLLVDLADTAPAAGFSIQVLSLMPLGDDGYADELAARGVPVASLDLASRWDPRAFPRAVRHIRALRPDVLHTHLKHADLVGAVAGRILRLPVVSTLHRIEEQLDPKGRLKVALAARARRVGADTTIAVSEAQRRWYLQAWGSRGVVTIRNGVPRPTQIDAATRETVRAELGAGTGDVLCVTLAVLRPGKGIDDLLEATTLLTDHRDLVFAIVGDGEQRATLEAQAADRPPGSPRVVFAGFRHDVARVAAAADLFVHPSHDDALPTALLHAAAAGVPAVATAVGGIPEIVTSGTGVLVPPHDPARLAEAISRLAADRAERDVMGTAARQRYEEEFEAGQWARRLAGLYADLLARRR